MMMASMSARGIKTCVSREKLTKLIFLKNKTLKKPTQEQNQSYLFVITVKAVGWKLHFGSDIIVG